VLLEQEDLDAIDNVLQKSEWIFLTGVYNASTQKLSLYINGEFKDEITAGGATAASQCLTSISGYTPYVKVGERMIDNEALASYPAAPPADGLNPARLLVDETRIWGVPNSTVRVRGGGYISAFTRNAAEIAFGASRRVYPSTGVYDPSLDYRYYTTARDGSVLSGNTQSYCVDVRVDDHEGVIIPPGTIGLSAGNLAYFDRNSSGSWDYGEYVWLDRNYRVTINDDGEEEFEYSTTTQRYYFDEDYDVQLSPAYGWSFDNITVTDSDGTSITLDPHVGKILDRVYYSDHDNSGDLSADDFIWIDYDHYIDNWYTPKYKRWAEAQGLALYMMFDDGGGSIEDYAWHSDWRTSSKTWKHAVRPSLPTSFGTWPPVLNAVGGQANSGDYWYVTDADETGFAWVIDSSESPSTPAIVIETLSNQPTVGGVKYCYVPDADADDFTRYDVLTGVITQSSNDPESGAIIYKYFWLRSDNKTSKFNATSLVYSEGVLRNSADTIGDGTFATNVLVGYDRELDLFSLREKGISLLPGTVFQLAVVATSDSGKSSQIALAEVTVKTLTVAMPEIPDALSFISFTPNPGVADTAFNVSLKNMSDQAGTVYIYWYRNLNLSRTDSKSVAANGTVAFSLDKSLVENADVWSFKAYFEVTTAVTTSRSRAIPPTLNDPNNGEGDGEEWIFRLVGDGYDEEEYGRNNANASPSTPTSVVITPDEPDENTLLVAMATGSADPEGDRFSYYYQWYQATEGNSFEVVENQNLPYWQSGIITTTTTTVFTHPDSTTTTEITSVSSSVAAGSGTTETSASTTQTGTTADGGTYETTIVTSIQTFALSEGDRLYVTVYAMDIYGNKSPRLRSAISEILADIGEVQENASESMAFEPNDYLADARQLLAKEDWLDMDDESVQTHYFYRRDDSDWVWFMVPATMNFGQKRVRFETNASSENEGVMFSSQNIASYENGPDTQLTLFDSTGKSLLWIDDYGNLSAGEAGGTYFARFDVLLDPGIYYVKVELGNRNNWAMSAPYAMHLGIEESSGTIGPTAPMVSLTPELPLTTDDLVCEIIAESESETGETVEYLYVWFRDGVVVPFGNPQTVNPWETVRFNLSMAKNNFAGEEPNVIPSKYTNPGEVWQCQVYAMDSHGYSEVPVYSEPVTIAAGSGKDWRMEINVSKEYRGSLGIAQDQVVVIGWHDMATHGFDPSLDEAMANVNIPGLPASSVYPFAEGRSFSVGFDHEYDCLSTDYRPYNRATSWLVVVEMGNPDTDTIAECRLSWQASSLPATSIDGMSVTQMRKRVDGVYEAVSGSATELEIGTYQEVVLDDVDLKSLQTDEYGQSYAVFRFSLGAPDEFQELNFDTGLRAGWNLISLKLTPLNNAVDEVLVRNGKKVYRGTVWQYEGGKYIAATYLVAGRGYWLYIPSGISGKITLTGNLGTSIPLNTGWNIIGPIHPVEDFAATYNEQDYPGILKKITKDTANELNIYKFVIKNGAPSYDFAVDSLGIYNLELGEGYWIETTETFELPVISK